MNKPGKPGTGGYALALVLVILALLSLLVATALTISKESMQNTSLEVQRARLACAAEAGITEAMLFLVDPNPVQHWPLDGTPRSIVFNKITVTVAVASEFGKIDLNGASPALLLSMFAAAGLDQTDAATMTDRVLDWREPGTLKRLNGAKTADYRAAGLPYGPRGGPFQSIGELNLVLGMTQALYARLAPAITVYNVLPAPEPQTAPALALRALGMDAASVATIMAARARGETAPSGNNLGPNAVARIPGLPGTVFTLSATAAADGITVTRTETIRSTGNPQNPFWILAWN